MDKRDQEQEVLVPSLEEGMDTDYSAFIGKDYLMNEQHSYLGFKIKYFGFSPVRGRFDRFDGTLFYDPENMAATSATVIIEVNSINTGQETRDEDLKKEGTWFNAIEYPNLLSK